MHYYRYKVPSAVDRYVFPAQIRNVTYTQPAIAGKQECHAYILLYIRGITYTQPAIAGKQECHAYILLYIRGILQLADFIKGQKLTFALRSRYLFLETQQLPGIVLYISSLPCRRQDDAENPETGTGCGLGKRLSLRSERLGFQPLGIIGTEFLVHVTKPCTGIELLELGSLWPLPPAPCHQPCLRSWRE